MYTIRTSGWIPIVKWSSLIPFPINNKIAAIKLLKHWCTTIQWDLFYPLLSQSYITYSITNSLWYQSNKCQDTVGVFVSPCPVSCVMFNIMCAGQTWTVWVCWVSQQKTKELLYLSMYTFNKLLLLIQMLFTVCT